jgi:hypothetical protein
MQITLYVSILFIGVSLTFLGLFFYGYMKEGRGITIARRVRLRMALMFGVVAIGLLFLHVLLSC